MSMSPASLLMTSVHRHHHTFRSTLSSNCSRYQQASVEGERAAAATPTLTKVERPPSSPGSRARVRIRLARGALYVAPEMFDVTPRVSQKAARRGANTNRRRHDIRAGSLQPMTWTQTVTF
ncbi:hypothetical protein MRX96_057084 [Rhipicephalus microplus]